MRFKFTLQIDLPGTNKFPVLFQYELSREIHKALSLTALYYIDSCYKGTYVQFKTKNKSSLIQTKKASRPALNVFTTE
jgi:hypothetical protein